VKGKQSSLEVILEISGMREGGKFGNQFCHGHRIGMSAEMTNRLVFQINWAMISREYLRILIRSAPPAVPYIYRNPNYRRKPFPIFDKVFFFLFPRPPFPSTPHPNFFQTFRPLIPSFCLVYLQNVPSVFLPDTFVCLTNNLV